MNEWMNSHEFVIVEFQEQISWESLKTNCWLYIKVKRRPNRTGDTLRLLLHYNLTMTTVLYKAIKNHLLSVTVLLASVSFHLDIYQLWWLQKCLDTEQRKGLFYLRHMFTPTLSTWCRVLQVFPPNGQHKSRWHVMEEVWCLSPLFFISMHQNAQQKCNKNAWHE